MAYNTKEIIKDNEGNPISQYFNPITDKYEPVEGSSGGNKVVLYNEDGTENNSISLIPILDKLTQLTGTVIDEETRKTNEVDRKSKETTRESNESIRKSNETSRVSEESGRVTKENQRVSAETGRVNVESNRVTAESGRVSEESTRVSNENTRKSNETARINAEHTRGINEGVRQTKEGERQTAESDRVSTESGRVTKEGERQSAEIIRGNNESTRQTNESTRQTTINELKVWEVYNNSKTYKPLNKVTYQGSSYICILQSTGNLPTNSTHWLMIAQKGLDGQGSGDMLKSVYDTNNNGIVDKAEDANTVNGKTVLENVPSGAKFTDTTYTEISTAEIDLGTASTLRTITARRMKYLLDKIVALFPTKTSELNNDSGFLTFFTKSDIGLGNVTNDKQMPISNGVLENYREKLVTLSGTTTTINLSLGNVFTHALSGNTTYSITNAISGQAHSFTLIITMGATIRTLSFPVSVKWQGGDIPDMTTVNKTYVLTFVTINGGTTWLGMFGGEF